MNQEGPKYLLPLSIVVAGIIIAGGIFLDTDTPIGWETAEPKLADNAFLLPKGVAEKILYQTVEFGVIDPVKITEVTELNLLWALGLSNKNEILEKGEMVDPRYGGPQNFASTGGWTLAKGSAMDHYSMHSYFDLTQEEQERVDSVSREIYRPCCSNSAHFPDCNHGMAVLGLLEFLASQGANESEMRSAALAANDYWFNPKPGPSLSPKACAV